MDAPKLQSSLRYSDCRITPLAQTCGAVTSVVSHRWLNNVVLYRLEDRIYVVLTYL